MLLAHRHNLSPGVDSAKIPRVICDATSPVAKASGLRITKPRERGYAQIVASNATCFSWLRVLQPGDLSPGVNRHWLYHSDHRAQCSLLAHRRDLPPA